MTIEIHLYSGSVFEVFDSNGSSSNPDDVERSVDEIESLVRQGPVYGRWSGQEANMIIQFDGRAIEFICGLVTKDPVVRDASFGS